MNTEKNQKIWLEKVQQNLILRGRSESTFINYKSSLIRFFNYYDENTNMKSLKEEVKNVIDSIDEIDLLINNAGIAIDNDYQNKSKQEFMKVIETNLIISGEYNIPVLINSTS